MPHPAARRCLALFAILGLAGCATGSERTGEDQQTCLTYGGTAGSDGYRDCLALRASQERDEMLINRADSLSDH